jgi:lysophospholipase L1-like esterase
LILLWGLVCLPLAAQGDEVRSARWQPEFAAFANEDARLPARRGGVVFVGSSSIRLWEGLESAFDRFPVVKRGFGGSTMADCTANVDRLVVAYAPRTVVVYAGENDLAEGSTPEDVASRVRQFAERVRRAQPTAHIAYLSIKPSPLRAELLPAIRAANALVRAYVATLPNAQFIDVHTPMLDPEGRPRAELFGADRLHMNTAGYALWRREISARLP